jgi:signal transduction histidine kinase
VLHEFMLFNRNAIVARARTKVAARSLPSVPTEEPLGGIPQFLDQLTEALHGSLTSADAIVTSAEHHGRNSLRHGFTVAEVVHDYGAACQAVAELADEARVVIAPDELHTLNRCVDDAIAHAVTGYSHQREQTIVRQESERLAELTHELRNAVGVATLAFQMLKKGTVGLGAGTSAVLARSLSRLTTLVDSSLAQVRLDVKINAQERVSVRDFIQEVEGAATIEAVAQGRTLSVATVAQGVDILADRQLLAGAVFNLLQNAFKFTRSGGRIALAVSSTERRVLFDVEDECGGLPTGSADALFRPYTQRGRNRAGLGLGLSIARKSVEANGGEIRVRDVPGFGCVFTVDLPRLGAAH